MRLTLTPHHPPPGCTYHAPYTMHPQISDHIPPSTHRIHHDPHPLFVQLVYGQFRCGRCGVGPRASPSQN
ncbi:hypothetical protein BGY98DRAFT_966609, partial [Russula aff. rugulosa BPL654]